MKKVAIVQSSYVPWKGYFDLIAFVDEFVLYDDVQYTRRDWRNRNKIKTPQGVQWLTVPVRVKGKFLQSVAETEIDGDDWRRSHWKTLQQSYGRAPHFREVAAQLEPIYLQRRHTHLSILNRDLIEAVCSILGIHTKLSWSSEYKLREGKTERLADICAQAGASQYVSGPSAKSYMEEQAFTSRGMTLRWFDYDGYPEYPQLWGPFEHQVSILDLLFNCGKDAKRFLRYVAK